MLQKTRRADCAHARKKTLPDGKLTIDRRVLGQRTAGCPNDQRLLPHTHGHTSMGALVIPVRPEACCSQTRESGHIEEKSTITTAADAEHWTGYRKRLTFCMSMIALRKEGRQSENQFAPNRPMLLSWSAGMFHLSN